jgi:hypothetical protein
MKLNLTVRNKKDREELDAQPFTLKSKEGFFSVVAPMFDDWLQTVDFDLRKSDAVTHEEAEILTIEFPDEQKRDQFKAWLQQANAKAKEGYRTMWP